MKVKIMEAEGLKAENAIETAFANAKKAIVTGDNPEFTLVAQQIVENDKREKAKIEFCSINPLASMGDHLVEINNIQLAVAVYKIAHELADYYNRNFKISSYYGDDLMPRILANMTKYADAIPSISERVEAYQYLAGQAKNDKSREQFLEKITEIVEDLSDPSKIVNSLEFVAGKTNDQKRREQAFAGIERHAEDLNDLEAHKAYRTIRHSTRDNERDRRALKGISS